MAVLKGYIKAEDFFDGAVYIVRSYSKHNEFLGDYPQYTDDLNSIIEKWKGKKFQILDLDENVVYDSTKRKGR